jgi:CRISPR/Cas system CMR-associated protein Cmr5 small subunit
MSLDQVRAHHAFSFVQESLGAAHPIKPDKLLGVARQLPAMLQTNGLLATWAHLLSKDRADRCAAEALLSYFKAARLGVPKDATPLDLLIRTWTLASPAFPSHQLRRLTREATVYSVWLKRAAETLCAKEDKEAVPAGESGTPAEDPA